MPEFLSGINGFRAFLNAASQYTLALPDSFCFGAAMQLLRQIDVFNTKQPKFHIVGCGCKAEAVDAVLVV